MRCLFYLIVITRYFIAEVIYLSGLFRSFTRSIWHSFIVILNYIDYKLTLQLSDLKSIDNFVKELKENLLWL